MKYILFVFWTFIVTASLVQAWPPSFGMEIEFSNPSLKNTWKSSGSLFRWKEQKWALKLKDAIKTRCESFGCVLEIVDGKWDKEWRVRFKDGYFFQISWDPTVVEILGIPLTSKSAWKKAQLMNDILFNSATSIGLEPSKKNSGHISIGFESAFEGNPDLFLDFYTDYTNRPELGLGILGENEANAPPLASLRSQQRDALEQILRENRDGNFKAAQDVAIAIQNRVHTRSSVWNGPGSPGHYQAIGLKTIAGTRHWFFGTTYESKEVDKQRAEIRAVFGQESFEHFALLSELLEKRIEYLKNQSQRVLYTKTKRTRFTGQEKVNLFWLYINEMGLSYERFQPLLAPSLSEIKPEIIFTKIINWEDQRNVSELLWWTRESLKSPWLQKKILELLQKSSPVPSEIVGKMVHEIANEFLENKINDSKFKGHLEIFSGNLIKNIRNPDFDLIKLNQIISNETSKVFELKNILTIQKGLRCIKSLLVW